MGGGFTKELSDGSQQCYHWAQSETTGGVAVATVTFDTLEYANTLKEAAVPDEQAEAQAKALRRAFEVALSERSDELATKHDVNLLRKDMEALENRLLVKLGKMLAIGVGLIVTSIGIAAGVIIKVLT